MEIAPLGLIRLLSKNPKITTFKLVLAIEKCVSTCCRVLGAMTCKILLHFHTADVLHINSN